MNAETLKVVVLAQYVPLFVVLITLMEVLVAFTMMPAMDIEPSIFGNKMQPVTKNSELIIALIRPDAFEEALHVVLNVD
jgi:hypothetical protein